jgi:hypothetical protein
MTGTSVGIDLISAARPASYLEHLELHQTPVCLSWLSDHGNELRHLVLSNIMRANLPDRVVKLEHVQVVELLWFEEDDTLMPTFQRNFVFPRLKYFSMSQSSHDLPRTLELAQWSVSMHDLEVFALRLTSWVEISDKSHVRLDISPTYAIINQKRQTVGYPRSCLIHGPVHVPSSHVNTLSFHIEIDKFPTAFKYHNSDPDKKRGKEALATRQRLLCNVDQDQRLSETQETQRFWERRLRWCFN